MSLLQNILTDSLEYLPKLPKHKRVALKHIMTCKTEECGTIKRKCDHCEHATFQYKSCGSRYCNQCGFLRKALWVDERLHESLSTHYFFYTFTIPQRLHSIFLYNEKLCYNLLFKTSADALKGAVSGQWLRGVDVGFMSVLHTNNQELGYHPHIHMLIPGGAISEDKKEWHSSKDNYLVPEKVLKRLFRTKLCSALKMAFEKGELIIPPNSPQILDPDKLYRYLYGCEKTWNVRMDALGKNSERVIKYLGRYVNKTAISDERIINVDSESVTIRVLNRNTKKINHVKLSRDEFIRRFLQHILPKGMTRIRYFGFLSCRFKSVMLSLLDKLISPRGQHLSKNGLIESLKLILLKTVIQRGELCSLCKKGHLKISEIKQGIMGNIRAHLFGPGRGST